MAYYNRSEGEQILDASLKMIRAMDTVDDMYQRDQQQVSQNNLIKLAQERGGLDRIDFNDVQNVHDWMALGALRKQNADMMSQQRDAYKDKIDFLNTQYNNEVMPMLRGATEAYNKGDYASYAGYVENLSNMAYSPYRYKFDPQSGSFLEYFRSDNKMGFTPTGRVYNPKDVQGYLDKMMSGTLQVQGGVNGQLMNINPDWAMTQLRMQLATADGNAQSMMQPKEVRGPDGKIYRASIINPIFDKERRQNLYNTGPTLVVFDPKTGQQVDMVSASEGKYQWLTGTDKKLYEKSMGLGKGGRGSGGGGRGRGGTGGNWELGVSDSNYIKGMSTYKNEDGKKEVDYDMAEFIETNSIQYGKSYKALGNLYRKGMRQALDAGLSRDEANEQVQKQLLGYLESGGQQVPNKQATQPASTTPVQTAQQQVQKPIGGVGGGESIVKPDPRMITRLTHEYNEASSRGFKGEFIDYINTVYPDLADDPELQVAAERYARQYVNSSNERNSMIKAIEAMNEKKQSAEKREGSRISKATQR